MSGIRTYPLFVAWTRPPMIQGVTQTFFIFNLVGCLIVFLAGLKLFTLSTVAFLLIGVVGFFFIAHMIGVICCKQDPLIFDLWLGKFELACPNRKIWKCNSYDAS